MNRGLELEKKYIQFCINTKKKRLCSVSTTAAVVAQLTIQLQLHLAHILALLQLEIIITSVLIMEGHMALGQAIAECIEDIDIKEICNNTTIIVMETIIIDMKLRGKESFSDYIIFSSREK
jgi:hypothetical protein